MACKSPQNSLLRLSKSEENLFRPHRKNTERLYFHIYSQAVLRLPRDEIRDLDGKPVLADTFSRAVRWAKWRAAMLVPDDELRLAIESKKKTLKELKSRLPTFMEDELQTETRCNGSEKEATIRRRPNRAAEIGLRKIIRDVERDLDDLVKNYEMRVARNSFFVTRDDLREMIRVMTEVFAIFVPQTAIQRDFRKVLAERFGELGKKATKNPEFSIDDPLEMIEK